MIELNTQRLYLRPLKPSDATLEYANWLNNPEVNQYLETRHSVQSVESCRDFIINCNADPATFLFGVFLKETNRHIGNAKIGFINSIYKRGQVSLFIGDKGSWGKGLSTEVVKELSRYGFENLGLHRLEAGCYEDNLASLKVFLRNGYIVEGFMREQVVLNDRRLGCFGLGLLAHEFRG